MTQALYLCPTPNLCGVKHHINPENCIGYRSRRTSSSVATASLAPTKVYTPRQILQMWLEDPEEDWDNSEAKRLLDERHRAMVETTRSMSPDDLREMMERRHVESLPLLARVRELDEALERTGKAYGWHSKQVADIRTRRTNAKWLLEQHKNETAHLALRLQEKEEMYDGVWDKDEIGDARCLPFHEVHTPGWHMARQSAICGSDVGPIIGVSDIKWGVRYSAKACEGVWDDKIASIEELIANNTIETDEDRAVGAERVPEGPLERGSAFEAVIARKFSDDHPEYDVLLAKATVQSKTDPRLQANLDGLLVDPSTGEPVGILEIKTGASSKWEKGVPEQYKAQVLHYLHVTGYDKAWVCARLDDGLYREFEINRGDPISEELGTYEQNLPRLLDFFTQAQKEREAKGLNRYDTTTKGTR